MSSLSREPRTTLSRRSWLAWATATALMPLAARAGCPCAGEEDSKQPAATTAAGTQTPESAGVLRVCADPNNLPFSNRNHEGFEDKIVEVLAKELGLKPAYDWLPQRLGFYRTALKTFDSNLVMAAPAGFEKALVTDAYYRSTYVFVTRRGMPSFSGLEDPALRTCKIGLQLTGGVTPPAHALAKRKIIDNIVGYPVFDETHGKPAERIIAAVASGEIDTAIVWGPQAGYFAKRQKVALDVSPVTPDQDGSGPDAMPFTFKICMAVRRSDAPLREKLNAAIVRRRAEIDCILDEFGVPRLPLERKEVGLPGRA